MTVEQYNELVEFIRNNKGDCFWGDFYAFLHEHRYNSYEHFTASAEDNSNIVKFDKSGFTTIEKRQDFKTFFKEWVDKEDADVFYVYHFWGNGEIAIRVDNSVKLIKIR